ncbi:helix-turn-helix transcriptional regulator [Streptomyces sp. BR123]|nr:helix-turn-helix transcriptional regulator [Streptomyces sp. BR123]
MRRLRECRGLSVYRLASLLLVGGRPIAPSAIAKVERGERQVTVDELTALAAALDVSPSALLLPSTDEPTVDVCITGVGPVPASEAWDWMDGRRRLDRPCPDLRTAAVEYALYSRPPIRRAETLATHSSETAQHQPGGWHA